MAEGLSSKHLVFPPGRKKTTLKSNDGSAQSCRLVPPSPFWSAEYAKVVAPIFFDSSAGFNKQFLDLCTTCERSVEHFLSIIHPAVGESPTKVCPTFAGTKVGHGFLIPTVRKTRLPEFVASPLLPPCPPFAKARVTPRYARPRPPHPLPSTQTGYRRGTAPKPAVVLLTSTSTKYNHRTASLPEVLPQYIHLGLLSEVGNSSCLDSAYSSAREPPQ